MRSEGHVLEKPERSKPDLTKDEEGFTKMQRAFLRAYLGPARYNATKAAKMAGYSERTAYSIGSELTKKPHIRRAIDAHLEEHARRCRSRGA